MFATAYDGDAWGRGTEALVQSRLLVCSSFSSEFVFRDERVDPGPSTLPGREETRGREKGKERGQEEREKRKQEGALTRG